MGLLVGDPTIRDARGSGENREASRTRLLISAASVLLLTGAIGGAGVAWILVAGIRLLLQ